MEKKLCAHGTCKKQAKSKVESTDMSTKEKRTYVLCKDHLDSLLDTCHRDNLLVNFSALSA